MRKLETLLKSQGEWALQGCVQTGNHMVIKGILVGELGDHLETLRISGLNLQGQVDSSDTQIDTEQRSSLLTN